MTRSDQIAHFEKYGDIYDGFRTRLNPILHYYVVFMMRKAGFTLFVYYLSYPEWTVV